MNCYALCSIGFYFKLETSKINYRLHLCNELHLCTLVLCLILLRLQRQLLFGNSESRVFLRTKSDIPASAVNGKSPVIKTYYVEILN